MAFHYTEALARVIDDVARTLPEFAHVRAERIAVAFTRARTRGPYGTIAKTVPLAGISRERPLPGGGEFTFRGRDILYLVYFYFPRFHDQSFDDKIVTIIHELFHMSPAFDGTLRLFPGRNFAHGPSRDEYEAHLTPLAADYARAKAGDPLLDFLRLSTEDLVRSYQQLEGLWMRMP